MKYKDQLMKMKNKNPAVDFYFAEDKRWQQETKKLREIILGCGLTEELKWGCPCYTCKGNNIILIHVFKGYCAVLFFKGALLQDVDGILIQQTKNVQAARQVRFTNLQEIMKMEAQLKAYIYEAIEVKKAGLTVAYKKTSDFEIPGEFQTELNSSRTLKKAFEALTPGRQRAYLFYFSQPKQSKTREARVKKYLQQILAGKGLND